MHADPAKFRHDLRNIVNSLRLALAAMELEGDMAEKLEWVQAIERTAERGVEVIDDYGPIQPDAA